MKMQTVRNVTTSGFGFVLCMLAVSCFGDNAGSQQGVDPPVDPTILDFIVPDEVDGDSVASVSVKVKGNANEQLSVAVDASTGTFSPQSKIVITGDDGEALFTTQYSAVNANALVDFTANVSNMDRAGESRVQRTSVYEIERIGNLTLIPTTRAEGDKYLIAYPLNVPVPGKVRRLAVIAPEAATAWIGLYVSNVSGSPATPLAKVMVSLVPGANEIEIPTQPVAAGKYWVAITYQGTPVVRKSMTLADQIPGWGITSYEFSRGLPDDFTRLIQTETALFPRNLYLVVRK
jgi:hypothetical protein